MVGVKEPEAVRGGEGLVAEGVQRQKARYVLEMLSILLPLPLQPLLIKNRRIQIAHRVHIQKLVRSHR